MKGSLFLSIAAVFCLSACEKQTTEVPDFVLKVSMSEMPKVSVGRVGGVFKTWWDNGDFIIVNGHQSTPLSGVDPGQTLAEFALPGFLPKEGDVLNVLYVGRNGSSDAGTSFSLPSPDGDAPMWATATYPAGVSMHGLCSFLNFSFRSTAASSITGIELRSTAGELLSGKFTMACAEGRFDGTYTASGGNSSSYRAPGCELPAGEIVSFSIPVLSGSYSKGFVARFYQGEYYMQLKFFGSGKVLTESRVYVFPEVEFNPDRSSVTVDGYEEDELSDPLTLIAGTYNILAASDRSELCPNNTWAAAKSCIADIIEEMDCDVMTVNELSSTEVTDLKKLLPAYSWVTKGNYYKSNKSYSLLFAPGIIYKAERLTKIADGIFWLCDAETDHLITDNPTGCYSYVDPKDGKEYSASQNRCCVWARFKDLRTHREFFWFATHPHFRSADINSSLANTPTSLNAGNIRSLIKQIPYVDNAGLPLVTAGDFNTNYTLTGYVDVLALSGLKDAFIQARDKGLIDAETSDKQSTSPGYSTEKYYFGATGRIDMLWTRGFEVSSYRHIYTKYNNPADGMRFPSDHLPVLVEIYFE